MDWYRLSFDEECLLPGCFQADDEDFKGHHRYDMKIGKRIDDWDSTAWMRSESPKYDGPPDDLLCNACGLWIAAPRLKSALDSAGVAVGDVQYLPIRILKSTGEELPGFHIMNVITRVKALDREHSDMLDLGEEIDPETGELNVKGIWAAALRASEIQGHDMIRLREFWPPVFVSQRFADVWQELGATGAALTPIEVHW